MCARVRVVSVCVRVSSAGRKRRGRGLTREGMGVRSLLFHVALATQPSSFSCKMKIMLCPSEGFSGNHVA